MAREPRAARYEADPDERRAWAEDVTNLEKEVDDHNRQARKAARIAVAPASALGVSADPLVRIADTLNKMLALMQA